MPSAPAPWGFASSTTSPSRRDTAQRTHGAERVAIVDFDVHHGNGTQDIFWNDKSVLYASSHQWPLYPGTGAASETGEHDNIVNLPLASGTGPQVFRAALRKRDPAARRRLRARPDRDLGGFRRASARPLGEPRPRRGGVRLGDAPLDGDRRTAVARDGSSPCSRAATTSPDLPLRPRPMSKRSWKRERSPQVAQSRQRRGIGDAVRALGPEMALEGSHDALRLFAVEARRFDRIPIRRQSSLQLLHLRAPVARPKARPVAQGRRRHEMANRRRDAACPREALAGILLARRGDVGMGKDARRTVSASVQGCRGKARSPPRSGRSGKADCRRHVRDDRSRCRSSANSNPFGHARRIVPRARRADLRRTSAKISPSLSMR